MIHSSESGWRDAEAGEISVRAFKSGLYLEGGSPRIRVPDGLELSGGSGLWGDRLPDSAFGWCRVSWGRAALIYCAGRMETPPMAQWSPLPSEALTVTVGLAPS